jgi:hypothetical protein
VTVEAETLEALDANQVAAAHALARDDWVALRALAEQEARLMDILRAIWKNR